jgi:hypothetical protein
VAAGGREAGHGLGMTAVYTHTRPEVRRQQLVEVLQQRQATAIAQAWVKRRLASQGDAPAAAGVTG